MEERRAGFPPEDYRSRPGICAGVACLIEASAAKAGNVHPQRGFAETSHADFIASAAAIAPVLDQAPERPLGETILAAVRATRMKVDTNTNLGIILLLAPLAAAWGRVAGARTIESLRDAVRSVLGRATLRDAELAYEAIRLANPGGLGEAEEWDVRGPPGGTLTEMMALAAGRDLVARQYANGFEEALVAGPSLLVKALGDGHGIEESVILCHLSVLARHGDSLIARKLGAEASREAARRAAAVLAAGWPRAPEAVAAFAELDDWLRADGNRRNPGAAADLTAASLFAALASGIITLK